MQELGTWVSRTHMEEPRKKRRLLAIPEVGEKQGERNILLCYPFAVHRSKVLFKKTFFFFFQRCFMQMANIWGVVLIQTTKRQKCPPNCVQRRFKLNRVALA